MQHCTFQQGRLWSYGRPPHSSTSSISKTVGGKLIFLLQSHISRQITFIKCKNCSLTCSLTLILHKIPRHWIIDPLIQNINFTFDPQKIQNFKTQEYHWSIEGNQRKTQKREAHWSYWERKKETLPPQIWIWCVSPIPPRFELKEGLGGRAPLLP